MSKPTIPCDNCVTNGIAPKHDQDSYSKKRKHLFYKKVIKFGKEVITNWTKADRINLLMAIATIALFWVAYSSLKLTQDETIFNHATTERNLRATEHAANEATKANENAVNALKQDSERFVKENQPFFQVINVRYSSDLIAGNLLGIKYAITNVGKFPAKITTFQVDLFARSDSPRFNEMRYSKGDTALINRYIIQGDSVESWVIDPKPMRRTQLDSFIARNEFIYLLGIIKYRNLINNADNEYRFKMKLAINSEGTGATFIYNENQPITTNKKKQS
jgi:hypothetical protein